MIETIIRTLFFYFVILFAYRLMGKREVGQLGVIDLIISILIAELVALGIEKGVLQGERNIRSRSVGIQVYGL